MILSLLRSRLLLVVVSVLLTGFVNAQSVKEQAVNIFIKTPGIDDGLVGISVKDFDGKNIITHNQNIPLTPASTLKTLTTATALEVLGKDFKFKTYIGIGRSENELVIKGTGDPTLGTIYDPNGNKMSFTHQSTFLDIWRDKIKEHFGTNQTPKDILIDDSYMGYQGVSRKWIFEDIGNYFGAALYGINVFDNSYNLEFNTENTSQEPRIVGTFPFIRDLIFTNLLTYNSSNKDNVYITSSPMSNDITLIGDIPKNKKSFVSKGAIPDPGLLLGQFMQTRMVDAGYVINNVDTSKKYYLNHRFSTDTLTISPFYVHESMALPAICRVVNVVSNNLYAESLIRRIGRNEQPSVYTDPLVAGVEKLTSYWGTKGLNKNELSIYDGCGLSPSDAVSADYLTSMMVYMQTKSANSNEYLTSFAKAGMEGTVRNVLANSKHKGKVFMKSGSIAGVQSFAGYYIDGNKKYAFTVLVNKYTCSRTQVVRAIEKLLESAFD